MAGKPDRKTKKSNDGGGNAFSDKRFAAAQTDPRFHRFPKAKSKVEIDKRFSGMFKDKAFQVKSTVDKRGRKLHDKRGKEDMRKYYRLQNVEEDWAPDQHKPGRTQSEEPIGQQPAKEGKKKQKLAAVIAEGEILSGSEESEELDDEERQREELWARARGLTGPTASSSDEDDSSSEDSAEDLSADNLDGSDEELIDSEEWGVGVWAANPDEKIPEIADATRRLAIVDLDWSKVRASDIFVMLQSFLRKGQKINKVTVYPSDYGLERMADEARFGPRGLTSGPMSSAAHEHSTEAPANGHSKQKGSEKKYQMDATERAAILEALNEQDSDNSAASNEGESDSASVMLAPSTASTTALPDVL